MSDDVGIEHEGDQVVFRVNNVRVNLTPDQAFELARMLQLTVQDASRMQAEAVAPGAGSPWLTPPEAAEYLRCPLSRVRKLTMTGELPAHRDGRRVLFLREDLDAYIRAGGAISP